MRFPKMTRRVVDEEEMEENGLVEAKRTIKGQIFKSGIAHFAKLDEFPFICDTRIA